ncbi:class I SAM-dependent methyltransferase [Nocardioides dilutus]
MHEARTGQVTDAAAEVYEEFFVPALFAQWTGEVLDRSQTRLGHRVLDVGCGTGVLTRAVAARVGESGQAWGIDPNPGMLAVATNVGGGVRVRAGRAEALPFPDASFDRVVSQFALMFFEDAGAAAREMARVLRPDGVLAVATWAAIDESPGYARMAGLLEEVVGSEAADALKAPFSLGTEGQLRSALGSGFPELSIRRLPGTASFPSVEAWVRTDILGWTLRELVDADAYDRLQRAAASALEPFTRDDGTVSFAAPALLAVAGAEAS